MSENYLKHYEMELIILSPVYIGSGEKIGKKEYIFLPLKKRVLVPDLGKMYTALMKKRADWEYQEYGPANAVTQADKILDKRTRASRNRLMSTPMFCA